MGWTYSNEWRSARQLADYLRRELGGMVERPPAATSQAQEVLQVLTSTPRGVIKDALVAYGHRYYAALQLPNGEVTIVACLLNHGNDRGERDTDSWGYKDMDESCGPNDKDCPLTILNLATDPPPNDYAATWRKEVRAYWDERRASMRLIKGAVVGAKVWVRHYDKNPYVVTRLRPFAGYNTAGELYRIPTTRIERIEAP